MALTSFLVKFLPYLMVFQSGEPSNEENSSTSQKKPFKTKFQLMGWLFGNPLQTFDNLLPVITPSTNSKLKFGKKSVFIEQKRIFFYIFKDTKAHFLLLFRKCQKIHPKKERQDIKIFFPCFRSKCNFWFTFGHSFTYRSTNFATLDLFGRWEERFLTNARWFLCFSYLWCCW